MANRYEVDDQRLRSTGESLGLKFDEITRIGSEGNMAGIDSERLLFSRRLDSRTFFVQDQTFGVGKPAGVFDGPDDELLDRARSILERLELPVGEIAEPSILREQTQVGSVDPASGKVDLEPVEAGKRLAHLTRQIEGLPVWSSNLIVGLTRNAEIGFLQLHWPEIPSEVLDAARKFEASVQQGWRPPERPGATAESVQAGIIHSAALGFVMDVFPAIRVVYSNPDPTIGRKLTLYVDADGNDVPVPRQFENLEPEPPASRADPPGPPDVIDKARRNFKALLLGNPNYFGTLGGPESVLPLKLDTSFEQIGCVGYEPQLGRLEAVVYIKRETGYGGGICSAGTPEFVRFYLSFDNGATWIDQGMSSFSAFDIPGKKPLEYDVTLHISPPRRFCFSENLPLVRAILSWNNAPTPNDPGFTPIWGEVRESRIQIAPLAIFDLGSLFDEIKFKLPPEFESVIDLTQPVEAAKQAPLSAVDLHKLYANVDVPGHRYLFPEIEKLIDPQAVAAVPPVPGPVSPPALTQLGIDLASVIDLLLQTDGNTSYEELRCVGLNPNEDALVGVLTVKLSSGYSGSLCSAGSKEFVAFWIDYGSGWTYAGTTSVTVHDLSAIPPGGIQYAVFLPVNLSGHRRPCENGPVTARVRAILSWQSPPPPADPYFVPTWGNREETIIHIKPGPAVDAQVPFLSAVGDIPESQIGAGGTAFGTTIQTGFVASDSPFGGIITIAGQISNPVAGLKYRVVRKPHGAPDSAYVPLTNEPSGLHLVLNTWDVVNGWHQAPITVHADALGYYPFEDYSPNHSILSDIVGRWFSTVGEDGQTFDLRIDLSTDGNPAHDVHSNVVTVLIDNTLPVAGLDIDLGAGVQCADFTSGVTFTGTYTATDVHFGGFQFEIEPSGPPNDPAHGVLPAPPAGASTHYGGAIGDPGVSGATYTLNTAGNPPTTGPMDDCGYALILHVWDRTNVDSGARNNRNQASVGFCLRAPE